MNQSIFACPSRAGFALQAGYFSPTHTPPPLSRPAGRKRGASCGRVCKQGTCKFDCLYRRCTAARRHIGVPLTNGCAQQRAVARVRVDLHTRPDAAPLSAPLGVARGGGDRGGKENPSGGCELGKKAGAKGNAT